MPIHTSKLTKVSLFAAVALILLCRVAPAFAGEATVTTESTADAAATAEIHYLGFASDLHSTEGALEGAFGNFPNNPEYVSLVGDMVGARGGDAPAFNSSDILARIRAIETCVDIAADGSNASIVWADHDAGVTDDAGIVKGMGDPAGYTSEQIYEGKNSDGSTAYYIYVVGFYHMLDGGEVSQEAAQVFKNWVADKDESVPVIVMCHAPLVAKRGDNNGATYWNEALNFAATGVEGITTEDQTGIPVIRDVIFLSGHNHTVDSAEYVYEVGSIMNVQIDASNDSLTAEQDASVKITQSYDEEVADLLDQTTSTPNVTAVGKDSVIYYTALTPGYLKTSGSATLLAIADKTITFTKYNADGQTNLGVTADGESVASPLVITRVVKEKQDDSDDDSGNNSDSDDNDDNGSSSNSSSDSGSSSEASAKTPAAASSKKTSAATQVASMPAAGDVTDIACWVSLLLLSGALLLALRIRKKE